MNNKQAFYFFLPNQENISSIAHRFIHEHVIDEELFFTRLVEFVPIKRSLSRLTENFSINFHRDDSVPGDFSQLSGFPD